VGEKIKENEFPPTTELALTILSELRPEGPGTTKIEEKLTPPRVGGKGKVGPVTGGDANACLEKGDLP